MRAPLAVLALAAATLGGCGHMGPGRAGEDYQRLRSECQARGGILVGVPGAATARPETDYRCDIRGTGRLPAN